MAARITGVGVTAQGAGATDLEGVQNVQLDAAQRAGVALPLGGAMVADNVRYLQLEAGHDAVQASGRTRSRWSSGLAAAQIVLVATCR
jgi:hypothetical protein